MKTPRRLSTTDYRLPTNSAFTLLEMAIVVVVIGLLVGGVMKGVSLVQTSRLVNARSFTAKSPVREIDGLTAWYEASSKESFKAGEDFNGSQLTEWRDISPGSVVMQKNKLTKTANSYLTYKQNGINNLPALYFSGSSAQKLAISNLYQGRLAQSTVFLVFQPAFSPYGTATILIDSGSTGTTRSIGIKSTSATLNAGSSVDTATATNPANFTNGGIYMMSAYFSGSSSKAYVNDAATPAGNGTINPGSNSLAGITIGSYFSGNNPFTGFLSEVIIYNRPLNITERKEVMKYLSKKYQIKVTGL